MIKLNYIDNGYTWLFDPHKVIKKITKVINKLENIKGRHIGSLIIVGNQEIQQINRDYRKIDQVTDVISFAIGDDLDQLPYEIGDIFLNHQRVVEQSISYDHSLLREFAFLVTHGIYHLLGYDHQTPDDEKIMFSKQEQVLQILKIERKSNA